MCSSPLLLSTWAVFGFTTLGLCLYTRRLEGGLTPVPRLRIFVALLWVAILGLLILHTQSRCSLEFLVWGAILLAVVFWTCVLDWCSTPREIPRKARVLTIGEKAVCLEELETKQQFYAPAQIWGKLLKGEEVAFFPDYSMRYGSHLVGGIRFPRYASRPA